MSEQTSFPQRIFSFRVTPLRAMGALLLASLFVLPALYAGCTLDPLQAECYRCPCGDTGLVCQKGFCILQQRVDTLNPAQIDQFIEQCKNKPPPGVETPPNNDSGPVDQAPVDRPDFCKGIDCGTGFVCDPRDGSCIQATKCPNNDPPLPDGTCPKKTGTPDTPPGPCDNVNCVPGKICEPTSGNCIDANCRQNPTICPSPQCCHAVNGTCTPDCRQCNGCTGGLKCNQQSGACEDDSPNPTCQMAGVCANSGDCCNNNCIKGIVISDSIASCECKSDKECKSGKCSTVIFTQPTNIKSICSCNSDADCTGGAKCKSFLGTKLCAR